MQSSLEIAESGNKMPIFTPPSALKNINFHADKWEIDTSLVFFKVKTCNLIVFMLPLQ